MLFYLGSQKWLKKLFHFTALWKVVMMNSWIFGSIFVFYNFSSTWSAFWVPRRIRWWGTFYSKQSAVNWGSFAHTWKSVGALSRADRPDGANPLYHPPPSSGWLGILFPCWKFGELGRAPASACSYLTPIRKCLTSSRSRKPSYRICWILACI